MLKAIRTFFGRLRGPKGNRQTIVEQGTLWRCTQCHLIFLTQKAGEDHECRNKSVA